MVTAGMLPRAAVREVEARLRAAGCPDADFDAAELFRLAAGGDARLADAPLGAEQAERLEALTARRAAREPLQYLCGSWPFLDFELAVGPGGALALEIGWQQREAVTALLAANGWTDIVCRKDFGGNDRCVMARKQ